MIQLVKGQNKEVIVTLTEKTTISQGYYIFEFIHETTKEVLTIVKSFASDTSDFKYRFNKFTFSSSAWANSSIGKYVYTIYESTINTTNTTGLNAIEFGKMDLNASSTYTDVFNEYSTSTSFKTYGG